MGARSCNDFVWSKEFIREFLGGLCHMENLRKFLASNLEFQSCNFPRIGGSLVNVGLWKCGARVADVAHRGL